MMQLWILGVVLCVAGCVGANFGLLVQKLSIVQHPPHYPEWKQPKWVCGFTIFIVAQAMSVVALSFAPQSMVGALSGLSLLSNSIFAPLLLNEIFTWVHLLSTAMLVLGSSLVVCFSAKPAHRADFTMKEFWTLSERPVTVVLISSVTLFMLALYLRGKYAPTRYHGDDESSGSFPRPSQLPSPLSASSKAIRAPADPFTFALSSAIVGALSVTLSKGAAMVIRMNVTNPKARLEISLLTLVVAAILCAALSVYLTNKGLRYFDALYVLPMYYALSTMCQSGIGGVFYAEFGAYNKMQAAAFCFGVMANILGVWILSVANTGMTAVSGDMVPLKDDYASLAAAAADSQHLVGAPGYRRSESSSSLLSGRSMTVPVRHTTAVMKQAIMQSFSTNTLVDEDRIEEIRSLSGQVLAEELLAQNADGGIRMMVAQRASTADGARASFSPKSRRTKNVQ
eukprot:GEMP01020452.1.p1 GENE.GEMP01020452.1~~GEMP01020452.1.p1  ORF type:complete len:454 (+),score=99.14 GEMP01020452.1:268-1629(+)